MSKTIPNLAYPEDITWWQLLFVILPASILSVILFTLTVAVMAVWQFSSWLFSLSEGLSIYSHQGADNDPRRKTPGTTKRSQGYD